MHNNRYNNYNTIEGFTRSIDTDNDTNTVDDNENSSYQNPDYSELSNFEKRKVEAFINTGVLKDVINMYKEYEFLYNKDDITYHGIIDLLLEYEDEFKIIDYKLKNITDDAYLKQLNGYKDYIESLTSKKVSIYLYSIIDETLQKM